MAYYFMVEKKKGEYEVLNIEKAPCFNDELTYSKDGAFTLKEIDMFTTMFNDECEMRKFLIDNEILPIDLENKSLSIRWYQKGNYNKVPYGFLYQKDIDYIFEPNKLVELILKRYYQKDLMFIKNMADAFSGYYICSSTAPEVRMYADISIRTGEIYNYLNEVDKNGDNLVKRLVKLLLFEHSENSDGYIYYSDKINYRNLHVLIAFINNYDMRVLKELKGFDYIGEDYKSAFGVKDRNKPKRRVKKKDELDGQLSFMDLL